MSASARDSECKIAEKVGLIDHKLSKNLDLKLEFEFHVLTFDWITSQFVGSQSAFF